MLIADPNKRWCETCNDFVGRKNFYSSTRLCMFHHHEKIKLDSQKNNENLNAYDKLPNDLKEIFDKGYSI